MICERNGLLNGWVDAEKRESLDSMRYCMVVANSQHDSTYLCTYVYACNVMYVRTYKIIMYLWIHYVLTLHFYVCVHM